MTIYHFCSSHETEAKYRQKTASDIFIYSMQKRNILECIFSNLSLSVWLSVRNYSKKKKKKHGK